MKQPLNWPALIVLAVVAVLGVIGAMAIVTAIPASSHDIVLAIVSGLVGAISMKAADAALRAQGGVAPSPTGQSAPQTPKPDEPAPAVRDGA